MIIEPTELEIDAAFSLVQLHLPGLTLREAIVFSGVLLAVLREGFDRGDEELLEAVGDILRNTHGVGHVTH